MNLGVSFIALGLLVLMCRLDRTIAHLPIGAIVKDTIGAVVGVRNRIREKLANREGPPTQIEAIKDIRDAFVEDYVENRDHRAQKMCEYLKQGQLYRGPCPTNPNRGHTQVPQGNYGSESEVVSHQRLQNRGGPNRRGQSEVIEIEIVPENRGGGRRGGRGRRPNRKGNNYGPNGNQRNTPIIHQPNQRNPLEIEVDDQSYVVRPETIVEEVDDDEEDFDRPSNRRGNRRNNGRQNGKPKHKPCLTTESIPGLCMPPAYCYSQYTKLEDYRANICEITNDPTLPSGKGICCPRKQDRIGDQFDVPIRVPQQLHPSTKVQFISLEDINNAAKEAQKFIQQYIRNERELVQRGMIQRPGSMQSFHQAFFGEFDPVQFQLTKGGFISLITTVIIKKTFKLSNEEARDGLYKYSIENTDLEQFCIKEPTCIQGKYRTIDGSCNNLQRPLWGKANTAFERLLPPSYDDGLHEPRTKSVADGSTLPSARLVSLMASANRNIPDPKYTLMLMQWGQFIDHDLTLAASTRAATGQGLACCNEQNQRPVQHHACFPIIIPQNDPFYSRFNQRCMHLVRNSPSPRSGCSLGHREQMNTLTHVIDGSMVYGSSRERSRLLRTFRGGKLKTSRIHDREFLPFDQKNHTEDCAISQQQQRQFKCFLGGDVRVNEQTGLTMIHNLLVREHNRIVEILENMHSNKRKWDDEVLYQEARRIVAAEIQHITYNEWLPIILGQTVMKQYNILPKNFDYSSDYNPKINPNILNEFATAAYRLHSLIQGTFVLLDNNGRATNRLQLHSIFNKPTTMYMPRAFDQYLNGFITEPCQSWDHFFTDEITNHLFQEENSPFGMDLVALNLQRGRDHGLTGYNQYLKVCGLTPARSFQDLTRYMQPSSVALLSKVYKHVDDIDLFIGGAHENPLGEALVGPTFACIVAEQARRLKLGDRFWYENGELPHSFTKKQLKEIRKTSLASLICDNADNIDRVQPLAFLRPVAWNQKVPCQQIARMNLDFWQKEKIWK